MIGFYAKPRNVIIVTTIVITLMVGLITGLGMIDKDKQHGNDNYVKMPKNYELVETEFLFVLGHRFDHNENCKCKSYEVDK